METVMRVIHGADKLISIIVCVVLTIALLFGGYVLWDAYTIYHRAGVPDEIMKFKPTASDPSLAQLQAINPDVRAWLTIDGTHINYPVLQGKSNTDYLDQDLYKNYSLSGSIFLDYRNSGDFTDSYSLIYGHHMDGGAMFGDLVNFGNPAYFDEHQTGSLIVPGKTYKLQIYAYLLVDAYTSPMFEVGPGAESFASRLDYIRKTATQYRDIGIQTDDRIVALSTCYSATTNGRSIVVAKLVAGTGSGGDQTKK